MKMQKMKMPKEKKSMPKHKEMPMRDMMKEMGMKMPKTMPIKKT